MGGIRWLVDVLVREGVWVGTECSGGGGSCCDWWDGG